MFSRPRIACLLLLLAPASPGADPGPPPLDLTAEIARAEASVEAGEGREAIDRLKPLVRAHPGEPVLARLLARAYLVEGNTVWAERVLAAAVRRDAGDWQSRAWLAWVQLSQGDLDVAGRTLEAGPPPAAGPEAVRKGLLSAMVANAGDDPGAVREHLVSVSGEDAMFAEDRALWDHLWRAQPGWRAPLSARVESEMGYTSNLTAGSPMDPGVQGGSGSFARLSLFTRMVTPRHGKVRAAIDLSARGHGVSDDDASDMNYLELSLRPGALIGWRRPVLVAWRAERLYVDDEPSKFYDSNRLETEFDAAGLAFVAGAGKRSYSNPRRTRWELDGGLGRSLRPTPRSLLLLAGSVRFYDAEHPAYDQRGATLVTALRMPAGPRLRARVGLNASYDDYHHSGGLAGFQVYFSEERRKDVLLRGSAELWSRFPGAPEVGIRYRYSNRNSTIDQAWSDNYDYTEHRATILFRWRGSFDPWAPKRVRPPRHVRLDYGVSGAGGLADERIQDLLRQDEQLRQASGCPASP
jgi:hypothetical protein